MDTEKTLGADEDWESGKLGGDKEYARPANQETEHGVDDALGLQIVSIRMDQDLVDSFRLLATFHGVGYQPLMRDALKRFAECELKAIVTGVVESQRQMTDTLKKAA